MMVETRLQTQNTCGLLPLSKDHSSMPSILDLTLVGELALLTSVLTQAIKSHPKVRGSDIVWWSGPIGILAALIWYLVVGKLTSGDYFINFKEAYRASANGIVGAIGASAGYNLQKALPFPNLLPTASEIDAQNLKEEATKQTMVVKAVATGVEPDSAKEVVGLDENDPPPDELLEAVSPLPTETKDEEIVG